MKVNELVEDLNLEAVTDCDLDQEITGGYVSDLLSHVMANGEKGNLWITIQSHSNIVAVASLLEFAAIIIPCGVKVDENTIKKANQENINILTTEEDIYQVTGKIYSMGI